MKFKTLLLTSAAAFAVVGGAVAAQAADLSVAEPVNYVKVCDAFGAGYWYIPGTDTCLKIGGLVRMDVTFHDSAATDWSGSASVDVGSEEPFSGSYADHRASWQMQTETHVNFTAKSMTEYGPLTAFVELRAQSNNADASNNVVTLGDYSAGDSGTKFAYLDTAYLELGMLMVGRAESSYFYNGGWTFDYNPFDADDNVDQVRLTWAMSGFGFQLAIEDPRDRWGTNLQSSYDMPDIVGNITWSGKNWDAKLAGGFGETWAGSGGGVQLGATFKLDQIAPGDQAVIKGAWASSETPKFAASTGPAVRPGGSVWSITAGFQHFWTPKLSSAVNFQYFDESGTSGGTVPGYCTPTCDVGPNDVNAYTIGGNLVWAPVTNFLAGVEGGYTKYSTADEGTWTVKLRMERDW